MPSFRIRPASEADIRSMVAVADVSYPTSNMPLPDGTKLHYFPDTPEGEAIGVAWRTDLLRKKLSANGKETRHVVLVAVEVGSQEDSEEKVVGWTAWDAPKPKGGETDESGDGEEPDDSIPNGGIRETFMWGRKNKAEALKRIFPNDEHKDIWELGDLCVHPDYMGRGLGTQLYRHGFDAIGAQSRDFWFVARTPAVPFYQKMGAQLPEGSRVLLRSVHDIMIWRHSHGPSEQPV